MSSFVQPYGLCINWNICIYIFTGVLLYNVLISAVQKRESAISIYIYITSLLNLSPSPSHTTLKVITEH